ncbi:MAG TPA: hypothetical protein VMM38_07560 [Aridibacter sp.]|nr:hypothetical protein [Aridibacter sp.]
MIKRSNNRTGNADSGAALVTVIFLTFILLIACVAMLSAVGAGTANSADVLAESKAYYAAESGLQSTINVLRNHGGTGLDYKTAVADCQVVDDSTYCLGTYLTYCSTGDCTTPRVVFANGAAAYDPKAHPAYSIDLSDPDNTAASLTYNTVGGFFPRTGVEVSADFRTVYIPDSEAATRTELRITNPGSTVVTFPAEFNSPLSTFSVTNINGGVPVPELEFRIDFYLTAPRTGVRSIRGRVPAVTSAGGTVQATFISQFYDLFGSTIELCNGTSDDPPGPANEGVCSYTALSMTSASPTDTLYADITPLEPYRLKVLATGFGPNGARKRLEGIVQKDFFNGMASGAATTMIGPSPNFLFEPGSSAVVNYSGCDLSGEYCVPAFGVTDPANLEAIEDSMDTMNGTIDPPPALLGDEVPEWQSSPAALDELVDQLRIAAQNSGRYFLNSDGPDNPITVSPPPGSLDSGQGITFCEGSCKIGEDGGGILVVTGRLTNVGGWDFKGLIIVTGEDGWLRQGGGGGQIIGNVVIAPYNLRDYVPENLSSTFLSPRYEISGGGASDIIYSDVSATFDGNSSVSNIMLGVSEK